VRLGEWLGARLVGGVWHLQSAPGTSAITKIDHAEAVPPATVRVHVRHGPGGERTLAYGIARYVAGSKVRFVERGATTRT
jgi:hypothetical protein